jgi:hypothetical protein
MLPLYRYRKAHVGGHPSCRSRKQHHHEVSVTRHDAGVSVTGVSKCPARSRARHRADPLKCDGIVMNPGKGDLRDMSQMRIESRQCAVGRVRTRG